MRSTGHPGLMKMGQVGHWVEGCLLIDEVMGAFIQSIPLPSLSPLVVRATYIYLLTLLSHLLLTLSTVRSLVISSSEVPSGNFIRRFKQYSALSKFDYKVWISIIQEDRGWGYEMIRYGFWLVFFSKVIVPPLLTAVPAVALRL